jgi:uncharacterized protein YdhG (YjbR/CyaY superfamily)
MTKSNEKSGLVDLYISQFTPDIQDKLVKLRALIKETAPQAEETIAYQMPTYRLNGNLVHFAAFKNHIGFYPTPSGISAFQEELAEYKGAKGSIRFPHHKPLPYNLIRKIVEYRVAESSSATARQKIKHSLADEAVEKATGKGWNEWFTILKQKTDESFSHKEIAKLLMDQYQVDGWWAQSITVEYERHLGKRQIGQVEDGTFQTAVSKTLPGDLDQVFSLWLNTARDVKEFNSIPLAGEPSISKTEKWRYWRVDLADGSRVTITVGKKTDEKSILTFSNEKLKNQDAIEHWKAYWKDNIKRIANTGLSGKDKELQAFMALKGQVEIDEVAARMIRKAELDESEDNH